MLEAFDTPCLSELLPKSPESPEFNETEEHAERAANLIFQAVGEDPEREGLRRTPERFAKALRELTAGYPLSPAEVIGKGVFRAEGAGLVSVRDVEFFSLCEHHLLPFWGKVSVAYYPRDRILGLSKIPRIVDVFARRFQVQERLTREVGETIADVLGARAVAVRIEARHLCMMMRGVEKQLSETATEFHTGLESLSAIETARLFESLK